VDGLLRAPPGRRDLKPVIETTAAFPTVSGVETSQDRWGPPRPNSLRPPLPGMNPTGNSSCRHRSSVNQADRWIEANTYLPDGYRGLGLNCGHGWFVPIPVLVLAAAWAVAVSAGTWRSPAAWVFAARFLGAPGLGGNHKGRVETSHSLELQAGAIAN
jgi:hypothetical protein